MGNPLYRNGNIETGNFIIHSQQFLLDMAKEGKEKKKKNKNDIKDRVPNSCRLHLKRHFLPIKKVNFK